MPSFFLDALIKTPFLGSIKLALAERSVFKNFSFYTTSDQVELDEIYRIRYRVYCEEYHYLDASKFPDKKERDEYDRHSIHLVVRHHSGELAATTRLILGSDIGLPIQKNFEIYHTIPSTRNIAEISRLIVGRNFRRRHLMLVLIKGIYLLLKQKRINDVFCVLDDRLIPNLDELGIPYKKIGKSKIYQGITGPYLIEVNDLEEQMLERNRSLLKFLSNGAIYPNGDDYKYSPH